MTRKKRRLAMIAAAGAVLAVAAALVLVALRDQIVFFYSPTEIAEKALAPGTRVRLGGLVAEGSVERGDDGSVSFAVTDTAQDDPGRLSRPAAGSFPRRAGHRRGRRADRRRRAHRRQRARQARRELHAEARSPTR